LGKRFVWWVKDKLDLKKMEEAAGLFVGMKNLQSFTDDDPEEKSTKVYIDKIELREIGHLILIRVVGSHFIWKMVRRVVGAVAEVGRGKLSIPEVERLLREKSETPARLTAPPSGLFLERVIYTGDKPLGPLRPIMYI
jgi:tRNA pseudouridine38-40 synthase